MPLENICLESKSSIIDENYCEEISGVNGVLSKDVLVIKGVNICVCVYVCMYIFFLYTYISGVNGVLSKDVLVIKGVYMCVYIYICIYIYMYLYLYRYIYISGVKMF
jgi:hypothetical protein